MRVPEEPVCVHLLRQNPVFTSLHLKYPVHVVPPPFMSYRLCIYGISTYMQSVVNTDVNKRDRDFKNLVWSEPFLANSLTKFQYFFLFADNILQFLQNKMKLSSNSELWTPLYTNSIINIENFKDKFRRNCSEFLELLL